MASNPTVYTEKVVRSFLRYQLTAFQNEFGQVDSDMRKPTSRTR